LAALSRTIGGGLFPPRRDSLERLWGEIRAGLSRRRTFAGCVFAPDGDVILVHRETRGIAASAPITPGRDVQWDNRFLVRVAGAPKQQLYLGALGSEAAKSHRDLAERAGIPRLVLPTLPALMDKHGILAVPPLGYKVAECAWTIEKWGFAPVFPLVGARFRLVPEPIRTI
jgi:hypothetical protein